MPLCSVRPYRLHDHNQLISVISQVCASSPWMATATFIPTPAWRHALQHPDCSRHHLLVAEYAGQVVGWCRLFPPDCDQPATPQPAHRVDLGIGLLPACRGQGSGTALLRQGLRWAGYFGFAVVTLDVHPENAIARHLFTRNGFLPSGNSGKFIHMVNTSPLNQQSIHFSTRIPQEVSQ